MLAIEWVLAIALLLTILIVIRLFKMCIDDRSQEESIEESLAINLSV